MKKINLLAGETSSGSGSTTISNLGLIQLRPLLDIEPSNDVQEIYPGDDGVSGYSFIRIKGVNNEDEKIVDPSTNEVIVTPDEGYLGIKQVKVNPVDSKIDSNISPDNIKHGVTILGVEGEYAPVTKPIEITPSTSEQIEVPDMGVDGFDSVTVKGVDASIDKNIQANNIRKGVEILGVTGNLDLKQSESKEITYSKAGDYSITPTDDEHLISKVDISVKELDLPDNLRYDFAIRYNGNASSTYKADFNPEFNEDDNSYFLFCNEQANLAENLVGFGYATSYIPYSYHLYDESYFKFKDGFVYLNVTKLGGASNSTGLSFTFQFKDHKIPAKCYYNCAACDGISIGATCQGIGEQAFVFEDKYCDFTPSYFYAHSNNSMMEMNSSYTLRQDMLNVSIYKKITIDNGVSTDIVINEPLVITDATVHNTYSGNGEERPDNDTASNLKYRYRIGFYDEYNNGCLNDLKGIVYSVNDNRSNDVTLYANEFSNRVAKGTDKNWRSVYIYSDTPFNNFANLHVYFFYKDNIIPQFAFYADQHIEDYFLNNVYLLNFSSSKIDNIGQFTYGQIAQYPQTEFPESSLNGLNSWVNLYNYSGKTLRLTGTQEVKNLNFGQTCVIFNDNAFIGDCTITGVKFDNETSPLAYHLVSDKTSKPTFLLNVNELSRCGFNLYTNNDRYTLDVPDTANTAILNYSTIMNDKACTVTNVDDIIIGNRVNSLSIKFGGDNYNPYRLIITKDSGIGSLTIEKDGDLTHSDIELVVPDSYSHNEVKSKLEEIGYSVTVKTLSTSNQTQNYYVYSTGYGRHSYIINEVPDYTKSESYHLDIQTSGRAVATDDSDSSYVDISKFTYKKKIAAIDITADIDYYGCYTNINSITIINNADNYKVVVHDDGSTWLYSDNFMDSSSGFNVLFHYKNDNPRIKEFSFYNMNNLQNINVYQPITLGYCAFYTYSGNKHFTSTAVLNNVEALALYGFVDVVMTTNRMNYAACGTTNNVSNYQIKVNQGSLDETDYTERINNSGKITVDLSPVFTIGTCGNSSWQPLNVTNGNSYVNVTFDNTPRKWSNRNQSFEFFNYSDEGGPHEWDLDISEIGVDKYAQSLTLNDVGQLLEGNKVQPELYTRLLNLFIPLNKDFKFEGTFSATNLRNEAFHITNVVMFNSPDNNTFHNGFSHSVANEQTLKFYYDEQYDITSFKSTIESEFDNVTVEFYPMTIITDNLKDCKFESGKNYGFVHSSRTRHSLIVVP